MDWYERARIHFGWVRYGEELTPAYARQVIQKSLDLGVDTLAFCVQVGGYALWESEITPRESELGDYDLIGALADLCKQHDLKFVPWWLGTAPGVARVLREHPSWQQVGPAQGGDPPQRYNFVCYNSPYRELLYEEIREILTKYDVDGIYFNQLPGSCYCPWCRAKFERQYGRPMPEVQDEPMLFWSAKGLPAELHAFRQDSIRSFCRGVRRIVNEVSPRSCYIQDWLWDHHAELAKGLADVILPEFYQKEDLFALGQKCRLTKTYFGYGPIWSNVRHAVDHDARHHPLRATQLLLANCVSHKASPLLSEQDVMDFDRKGIEDLANTFEYVRSIQSFLKGADPVRYAALLHSKTTQERFPDRFDEAFGGFYRLLSKSHIPFEIVNEEDLLEGALSNFKVLMLPDVAILQEDVVETILWGMKSGLGVVATYMTGLLGVDGQFWLKSTLASQFGVQFEDIMAYDTPAGISHDPQLDIADLHSHHYLWHYGSLRASNPFEDFPSNEGLFGFLGGFVKCSAVEGAQVIGDIHTHDQIRMNALSYNRRGLYPGPARWPLAILQEKDGTKCAYFAPQIEAEWRRAHAPQLSRLLTQAVYWAGGKPPVSIERCPWSVDVRLFHNPEKRIYLLLLVNLTTDPPKDLGRGPGVFESVIPMTNLRFTLGFKGSISTMKSHSGEVEVHPFNDGFEIVLPFLDLYDSIMIEYK